MNLDQYPLFVIYLLLFLLVGVGFIFVHLVAGKFIRPAKPESEKLTIYECGEPTIGSAWIQFDLRFYVVALLFVIFDVEVAFFFPWAVVFGKANALSQDAKDLPASERRLSDAERVQIVRELIPATDERSRAALDEFAENVPANRDSNIDGARQLAWIAFCDIAVFFGVLLVGFAYLWKRGDLEWVRSVSAEKMAESGLEPAPATEDETLVGAAHE